jgi:hypothetical protein
MTDPATAPSNTERLMAAQNARMQAEGHPEARDIAPSNSKPDHREEASVTDVKHEFQSIATRRPVIGEASDGSVWTGTESWLVKRDQAIDHPKVDRIVSADFSEVLERVRHGEVNVIAEQWATGPCRLYLRPDGITVWLPDDQLDLIETWLGVEDEFEGETMPRRDLDFRQSENRWAAVGLFDGDELLAVVMPVRGINAHLSDGAGRPVDG